MARCVGSLRLLSLLTGALMGFAAQPALAAQEVDLELVIATDVSRSIVEEEAILQRQGVAAAFRSPEVARAIQAGPLGRIAVAYVDWSQDGLNRIIVDWQVISSKAGAEAFSAALLSSGPTFGNRTSISSAMLMGADMLETNDYRGTRRVIDISGDGPNNIGLSLAPVREEILAKGIVINGLPIIVENAQFMGGGFFAEIDKYYAACVIGGRGAFLIVARGIPEFAMAIRHKLVLELSHLAQPVREEATIMKASATGRLAQLQVLPRGPTIIRPPAVRETNCDRQGGFGGFDNRGGFR